MSNQVKQEPVLVTETGIHVYGCADHFKFILPATDGTTGIPWIARLESKRFPVGHYAKSALRSPDFKPTIGVITEVAVLKGTFFEDEEERITENILDEAVKRTWVTLNAETACIIREIFTNEEIRVLGLVGIITMHEPISDSDNHPNLLAVRCRDDEQLLDVFYSRYNSWWHRWHGFAFAVSHVNTQS